jgi:hypothetical protein
MVIFVIHCDVNACHLSFSRAMISINRYAIVFSLAALGVIPAFAGIFDAWHYRMKITCVGYTKSETLADFPLLVTLSNNVGNSGFDYRGLASAEAGDLRFTAADRVTELPYEIESWNTTGVSQVWVKVPSLASSADHIYAFWGNAGATRPAYTTNGATWSSGYLGVWHMKDATNVADSTGNGYHGTGSVGIGSTNGGIVGNALALNGISHYVEFGTNINMRTNPATLSLWFRTTNTFSTAGLLGKTVYGGVANRFGMHVASGNLESLARFTTVNSSITTPWTFSDGQWHLATVTFHRTGNMTLYADGIQRAALSISVYSNVDMNAAYKFWIGTYGNNSGTAPQPGYYFPGWIDESSMMTVAASSNWVWASWASQAANQTFCTFGPATRIPRGSVFSFR